MTDPQITALELPKRDHVALREGFWLDVLAATEEVTDWETLDNQSAALKAWIAWADSHDIDALEAEKGTRCIERRRGQLLGPEPRQGERTDLQLRASMPEVQNPKTSWRWRQIAWYWDDLIYPHLLETTKRNLATQVICLNLITRHTPANPDITFSGNELVRHGDFRVVLDDIPDHSVDLIVTDPPYPKDELPLWTDLAEHAARLLGPRGILFAWSGQLWLPQVLNQLSEHLTYGWTFALQLPGSGSRVQGRQMIQAWKPVLAYTTGTWPYCEWGDDWLISPKREKGAYEWAQNAAPAQRLIERYAPPDGLVVDPYLGTGTFGLAALTTGRRFLGVELDADRARTAIRRLADVSK